jgi:hypothetical protein
MNALTNSDVMRPYTNQVLLLLLNRLQSKPSALFTQAFVYFMTLLSAVESVGPDFVIQSLDAIQPGYVCLYGVKWSANVQIVRQHPEWCCTLQHPEGFCQGPKSGRGRSYKVLGQVGYHDLGLAPSIMVGQF